MHPHIPRIIPNILGLYLQCKTVRCLLIMLLRMPALIPSTPYIATYQTNPKIIRRVAHLAEIEVPRRRRDAEGGGEGGERLHVPTDGASATAPFGEAGAVEDVLAEDGQEAGGVVHALEADGAGGEFDQGGCGWWERSDVESL
jgi:hypothetical protein